MYNKNEEEEEPSPEILPSQLNQNQNNNQIKENERKFSFGDSGNNQINTEKKEVRNANKKTKIFKNEEK